MYPPPVLPPLTRSLDARSGAPVGVSLGTLQYGVAGWYLLEFWSGTSAADPRQETGGAWGAVVSSATAGGVAQCTNLTMHGSSRRCFYGASFEVTAYNFTAAPLNVAVRGVPVSAPLATANVCEISQQLPGGGNTVDIAIPPYATAFSFDVPAADRGSVVAELLLPTGAIVGQFAWSEQPAGGIPIGSIGTLRIRNGTATNSCRFVFQLT